MKRPKKVTVVWRDHHACLLESEPTHPLLLAPQIWESRGYLVSINKEMVEIARDVARGDHPAVDGALRIMRDCIISPESLKPEG